MTDAPEDKELVEAVKEVLLKIKTKFILQPNIDEEDAEQVANAVIPIIQKHYEQCIEALNLAASNAIAETTDLYVSKIEEARQDERERIAREQATPSAGMIDAADASAKSRRWKTLPYYDSWSVMAARFWRDKYGIDPAKLSEVKP